MVHQRKVRRGKMAKEFFGEGDSAIREDRPMTERNVVVVAIKHPTEEKISLCTESEIWLD